MQDLKAIIGLKDKFSFRFVNSETLISEFKTGVRNQRQIDRPGDYRRPTYVVWAALKNSIGEQA